MSLILKQTSNSSIKKSKRLNVIPFLLFFIYLSLQAYPN